MPAPRKSVSVELGELMVAMGDTPQSIDELAAKLDWPRQRVNDRLVALNSKVSHEKVRVKHASVIKYTLKSWS